MATLGYEPFQVLLLLFCTDDITSAVDGCGYLCRVFWTKYRSHEGSFKELVQQNDKVWHSSTQSYSALCIGTLNPKPSTLNLNRKPSTLHPKPSTLKPKTQNP